MSGDRWEGWQMNNEARTRARLCPGDEEQRRDHNKQSWKPWDHDSGVWFWNRWTLLIDQISFVCVYFEGKKEVRQMQTKSLWNLSIYRSESKSWLAHLVTVEKNCQLNDWNVNLVNLLLYWQEMGFWLCIQWAEWSSLTSADINLFIEKAISSLGEA